MNRRDFIRTVAAGTLAGAALITFTPIQKILAAVFSPGVVQLTFKEKILQGTRDGKVFESQDAGKTWKQVFNFGSHCAVQELVERGGLIYARIGVLQFSFVVQSADGRTWLTATGISA